MPNDRSDAALRERLRIAEKAAQGPWKSDEIPPEMVGCRPRYIVRDGKGIVIVEDVHHFAEWQTTATHIAANSPDVVKADIEEILLLRAENERLNKEADWLAGICTMGYCANHDLSPICHQERRDCRECIRKTARKAVKETKNG